MKCKINESKLDRIVRFVLSLILFFWAVSATGTFKVILYIIAIALLITAVSGFCAGYSLFKINTNKNKSSNDSEKVKTAEVVKEHVEGETLENPTIEMPVGESHIPEEDQMK